MTRGRDSPSLFTRRARPSLRVMSAVSHGCRARMRFADTIDTIQRHVANGHKPRLAVLWGPGQLDLGTEVVDRANAIGWDFGTKASTGASARSRLGLPPQSLATESAGPIG